LPTFRSRNAELVTQCQHLGSELGIGLGADQGEVGEIADKLVEEGEEHGGGSCPIDPRPARATASRPPQVYALPAQGAGIRVDAARCTAHGLLVLVYAPGYWWAARRPSRHPHVIAIAWLGKLLGPVGFAWAAATDALPLTFGLTTLTNDLIWLPAFGLYLRAAVRPYGGLRAFLSGAEETNEDPEVLAPRCST